MKLVLKVATWSGFGLLVLSVLAWVVGTILIIVLNSDQEFIASGIFIAGVVAFVLGFALLLARVSIERIRNKEDDYYSKNVQL